MTIQTEQVAASLAVAHRTEGVRRTDNLDGYARCMGEGIRLAEAKS